ncbi:VOC family protein [Mucilaginibacter sp.]|uniref:VOC family protein n=1 Tax=Mucilaginibacter sp. TaxID=1882438 RepID=UPI0028488FA9|nr:VOC family protein [Mucilaginibacter sp.]MDR3693862.1 VOC family protein [Mucilaginibacter sp.]
MTDRLNITLNKLQHVGIPVTDIAVSAQFYNRFGFKNVMQSPFTFKGDTGICIMMQHKDIMIELYQMPAKQLDEIRSRNNGHIDHIAFDVDEIDAVYATLKADGNIRLLEEAPVSLPFWKHGCKYFNILGPDNERLKFNEILKG